MLNPRTGVFRNFNAADGLQGNEFNVGAYFKNGKGEMFFGGVNGMTSFYPGRVTGIKNPHMPPVVITSFLKWNKKVELSRSIREMKELKLSYRDRMFGFEFAALDYSAPSNNGYAYKMEGFNEDWVYTDAKKRYASFTQLEPGAYTFRVKASNSDGVWNEQGASIRIIITPPCWKTWWFRVLLALLVAGLAYLWHQGRMKHLSLRLKSEAEMERTFDRYEVSKREREIIQLILKGKTNKNIEDELYISLNTVKSYIYRIYKKFGVQNRLELIHLIQKSVKKV
jgi:DNA-binding CsgD family transcriptional regulator